MTTDIAERLRSNFGYPTWTLCREAAHEIERLLAYVEEWKTRYDTARLAHEEGRAEIERLRAIDWREIAQRLWDGDYASVDELAKAMEHEMETA